MISRLWHAALIAAPIRLWAIIGATIALTITQGLLICLIWKGGWPAALAPKQLDLIGWASIANSMLIGVGVVSIAAVKVKAAGPGGFSFDVDGDEDPPPPAAATVTTTTTATVAPQGQTP